MSNQKCAIGKVNAGYEIIAQQPYSDHPDDKHLFIVLGRRPLGTKEYVTWMYNAKDGSFNWGKYFNGHFRDKSAYELALESFKDRSKIYDYQLEAV